jgi:hypothetical protein
MQGKVHVGGAMQSGRSTQIYPFTGDPSLHPVSHLKLGGL